MRLGKSNHALLVGVFLLMVLSVRGQDVKNFRYRLDGDLQINYAVNEGTVVIDYSIPEIDIKSISNEHGAFYRLSVAGHSASSDPGKPELPVYSRLITVPEGSGYRIRISQVKSTKIKPSGKGIDGMLWPSQESEAKGGQKERPPFRIDRKVYGQGGYITSDTVSIVPLGKVRNTSLANLYISPVRYNPRTNSLEIIKSMKIEVEFSDPLPAAKSSAQESTLFDGSVSKGVLDFNRELIPGYTDKPVGMIILTDTAFKKQLKPFLEWKTQKGFKLKVLYKGAAFAGTTWAQLKQTIAGIYNSATEDDPAPDYLLILGDVETIPYYGMGGSGNITDMYYGEFDGSGDYIPEMYIGRLPVRDTSEAKSVLEKIIQYEKFQFADTNKFHKRALATTGYDPGRSIYMDGQIKYSVTNYLTPANRINEYHFYHPTSPDYQTVLNELKARKDSILKLINIGTSFINYSGHGDVTGWLHLNITAADSASLKNRNMYPLIISNACLTGKFNTASSLGNRLVLEKNRGAIGFIGCSNDSYWDEDYFWSVGVGTITNNPAYAGKGLGIFDRLFHTHNEYPSDWYFTLGQINYSGNLSVSASTTQRKKYYWETYNIIGDPSMIPIIGEPKPSDVILPDTLPDGIRSLTLTIDPFSYIAVSHFDTLWDASFAGPSGSVTLEMPGLSDDSCLVVITGQNRYPVIKTIYLSAVEDEFLNLTSTIINDNLGNGNQQADFMESLYLKLTLSNLGLTDAHDVYARISSSSPFLTIEKDSAFVGSIPGTSEAVITDKLLIKIADDIPDMGIAPIDLILKSLNSEKHYKIDLKLHSPVLKIMNSCVIDDSETGNGDFIADPGETFDLVFRVMNEGSSDASGQFNISTVNEEMTILVSSVKSDALKFGEITEIKMRVKLDDEISSGSYISLSSILSSEPFTLNKDFTFRIGRIRESFEAMSFDIFPWINNSPVPWITTGSNSAEGNFSARSGITPHNGTSSLVIKTFYPAADSLKFYCMVSSEPNYDYLSFILNGKEIFKISGEISWKRMALPVPAGLNRMEWIYKKDVSVLGGSDCAWIDMIDFATAASVAYIRKDLHVARITEPVVKDRYGQEVLTVKVLNTGKDIINGFNLSYAVKDQMGIVSEHFKNAVNPYGDTVTVSFKTKVDLSKYGIYDLIIYGSDNNDDYVLNDTVNIRIENTKIKETLRVFPNPFKENFNVLIYSEIDDRVKITITNLTGVILYETEKDVTGGYNTINIPDARLIPSLYYLNIRGKHLNSTVPLLKLTE